MKSITRLAALVLVLLASLATLPSAAQAALASGSKCADFCAIVYCGGQQTCGPYVDSTGTLRCGCYGPDWTLELDA